MFLGRVGAIENFGSVEPARTDEQGDIDLAA